MARSAKGYLRLLQSLLPHGPAWNRDEGSGLTEFLYGQAEEFARVESRSETLLRERDTRYATELLVDHELDLGIPDECSELATTIQQRRNMAHTKLIASGRQDKQYFIDLAASLGFTITITEFLPSSFKWQANMSYWLEWIFFRSGGSESGDPLVYVPGYNLLACVLNKYKPAHTVLEVVGIGAAIDRAFDSSFLSLLSEGDDYLTGPFSKGYNLAFDIRRGGGFDFNMFDSGFDKSI